MTSPFVYRLMLALLFLSSCATIPKEDCARTDWFHVGKIDGRMGQPATFAQEHRKACEDLPFNSEAYEMGRLEGIKDYCTPPYAYRAGADGRQYSNVCPKETEGEVLKQFNEGRQTFSMILELRRLRRELAEKKEQQDKDRSVLSDIVNAYSLISGISPNSSEEHQIEDLEDKIHLRKSLAPPGGQSFPKFEAQIEASPVTAMWSLSAIMLGSTIGFGLGHSAVGIYKESGWQWTLIDITNIVGLSVISNQCTTNEPSSYGPGGVPSKTMKSRDTADCIIPTLTLVSGLLVSRIWQGVEIGRYAAKSYSPYQVSLLPHKDGASLVANWTW